METRACIKCRRLFMSMFGEPLCPECNKEAEEVLKEVKDYIRENPGCNIKEVVAFFDNDIVTEKQVRAWVKEERLQFTSAAACGLTCESCGIPIISGRFCDKCRVNLQKSLNNAFLDKRGREETPVRVQRFSDNGERMRFLGKKNK